MNISRRPVLFILILISAVGLWQFADGVRSVNIVGLFASGALCGVAIAGFSSNVARFRVETDF